MPAPVNTRQACAFRSCAQAGSSKSEGSGEVTEAIDMEHATGLERAELEAKAKGVNLFEEAWLNAPPGTPERPVEVTSVFSERIVGVTDPHDDSEVTWGLIKEGDPPRQIVPGGEFFVLKRLPKEGGH